MYEYNVPMTWKVGCRVNVRADNETEAKNKALSVGYKIPDDCYYISQSFGIDNDVSIFNLSSKPILDARNPNKVSDIITKEEFDAMNPVEVEHFEIEAIPYFYMGRNDVYVYEIAGKYVVAVNDYSNYSLILCEEYKSKRGYMGWLKRQFNIAM